MQARRTLLPTALAVACLAGAGLADPASPQTDDAALRGSIRAIDDEAHAISGGAGAVDIDFPGGTALDYARLLRKGAPTLNLAFPDTLGEFPLPSLMFRAIDVGTAVMYLDRMLIATDRGSAMIRVDELPSQFGAGEGMWRIAVEASRGRAGPAAGSTERIQRVWSVRRLMEEMESEAVLGAIEASLALFGEELDAPLVRVHEPSGLLLMRGLPEQIDVVQQVLGEIDRSRRSRAAESDAEARLADLEARIADLEAENAALRARLRGDGEQ